jgi:MFS family permease
VVSTTILQRLVPDAMRGRAIGAIDTLTILAYAAGSLVLPVLAGPLGVGTVLVASAAIVVVGALGGVVLLGDALPAGPRPEIAALTKRLAGLPLFTGVPEVRLATALSRAKPVAVRAGDAVIRQGEAADRFYVILDGDLQVSQAEAGHLRTLGRDDVFGEIGLLTGAPRTATVTAAIDGRLLALDADDFLELVSAAPDLRPRLLALYRGSSSVSVSDSRSRPAST